MSSRTAAQSGIKLLVRQFLHQLLLLLCFKAWRSIFFISIILLMNLNLITWLVAKHTKDTETTRDLTLYGTSEFVSSGHKVLVDRSSFPAHIEAISSIVKNRGGSSAWMKDCSPDGKCREDFINELDSSVIGYIRYAKTNASRNTLECFWVKDSNHRCAFLYQLMVQGLTLNMNFTDVVFKDVQFFTLTAEPKNKEKKRNITVSVPNSICADWMDKSYYTENLITFFTFAPIGILFYYLITTVSFIRTIKTEGFFQQLVRNGLSVSSYWLSIWFVTAIESLLFSSIFALSHVFTCPGVYATENILKVILLLAIFFLTLAGINILLELLVSSMVAISVFLLVFYFALTALGFRLYKFIMLKRAFLTYIFPILHVWHYIETHMTAMASVISGTENLKNYSQMLWLNAVALLVLIVVTIYVDFLLRCGNGLCLPPTFPFTTSFWFPSRVKSSDEINIQDADDKQTEPHIEPVVGQFPSIVVDRISKAYSASVLCCKMGPTVLQELSCTIYKNQITALIGHNGAGKSTLIKILTGDESPNSGFAYINGVEATDALERLRLRGKICVCPQFDALCGTMSVIECIRITLASKGVSNSAEMDRARAMLRRLGLGDKENVKSIDMSGGQKRKLSTILTLLGDPSVVVLDEPTSGLDPVSRRQLWQLLQEEKIGRSIVLCTQFMDEADILADRKIFLCGGQIVCAGSSMFLKRAFGCSFTLNVSLKSETDAPALLSRLQQLRLKNQFKTELQLEVPASKPTVLVEAVQTLESAKQVEAFGLSQASLDDVFMGMSGVSSAEIISAFQSGSLSKFIEKAGKTQANPGDNAKLNISPNESQKMKPSNLRQFLALLRVNVRRQVRTCGGLWNRLGVPGLLLALLTVYQVIMLTMDTKANAGTGKIDVAGRAKRDSILRSYHPDRNHLWSWRTICVHDTTMNITESFRLSCAKFSLASKEKNRTVQPELISKPESETFQEFMEKQKTQDVVRKTCGVDKDYCSNARCRMCVIYYSSSWDKTDSNNDREIAIGVVTGDSIATAHAFRKAFSKLAGYFGARKGFNGTTALSHMKALTFYPFVAFELYLAVVIFCLIPASYLSDPIEDIVSRVRGHLISMGMTQLAYWVNVFLLHWLQYAVWFLLTISLLCLNEAYRTEYMIYVAYIPALIFGTVSNQLAIYAIAVIIRSPNPMVSVICNLAAFILPVVMTQLRAAGGFDLTPMLVLLPPSAPIALLHFSTAQAAYRKDYYHSANVSSTPGLLENFWRHSYVKLSLIMMPVHIVILLVIVILAEYITAVGGVLRSIGLVFARIKGSNRKSEVDRSASDAVDRGVMKEQERLMQLDQNPANMLEIRGLKKIYPNGVQAVRGVTFGVVAGEIFGLLGANGAGKSTSMSVIVGEDTATEGSVEVRTKDGDWLSGRRGASMGVIGYCPQHNPLFDSISVNEHMMLYADIRGVPSSEVENQVTALIQGLGLQPHKDKFAGQLSGGNKRRLCLAIALLGDPTLIVIDEASTGVDPENKRFIWGAIRGMLHSQRSVIVTTHSMEEVEALCSRVGIMNKGRIIAFGTVQQLRSLYGDAYTLDVQLQQEDEATLQKKKSSIKSAIAAQFKGAVVLEDLFLSIQFYIPTVSINSLSAALKWLHANQTKLAILYCTMYQMSLDQVFVKLVKQYHSSGEAD